MKKSFITFVGLVALAPVWAQDGTVLEASAGARMAYQERQALAEVPRLVQQFEVLANNQDQIAARLVKVESGSGDSAELRAEIEKLRAEVAELRAAVRRDQDAMRREIVEDLTRRLNGISQQMQQNQTQALAQIQARAEAALQAAEASAKAAREQAEYTKRNASRPAAPAPRASGGAASAIRDALVDRARADWSRFFQRLGFTSAAFVEKTRRRGLAEFDGRHFEITLDVLEGIGVFTELETTAPESDFEAAREVVMKLADRLGLRDSIVKSYLALKMEAESGKVVDEK